MHDHRVGPGEGVAQPAQILVMVKRVAAGPVDQADVGIGCALSVIIVARSRIEQAIRDARRRYCEACRVGQGRHCRTGEQPRRLQAGARAIAEAEPAARQTDLAEARPVIPSGELDQYARDTAYNAARARSEDDFLLPRPLKNATLASKSPGI